MVDLTGVSSLLTKIKRDYETIKGLDEPDLPKRNFSTTENASPKGNKVILSRQDHNDQKGSMKNIPVTKAYGGAHTEEPNHNMRMGTVFTDRTTPHDVNLERSTMSYNGM